MGVVANGMAYPIWAFSYYSRKSSARKGHFRADGYAEQDCRYAHAKKMSS